MLLSVTGLGSAYLITASLGIFLLALICTILHIMTFAPGVLGSVSAVFLNNIIKGVIGSSTWSSDDWAICRKDEKLYLGDVEPAAEVDCIALATLDK
jgi:hypothetical protein